MAPRHQGRCELPPPPSVVPTPRPPPPSHEVLLEEFCKALDGKPAKTRDELVAQFHSTLGVLQAENQHLRLRMLAGGPEVGYVNAMGGGSSRGQKSDDDGLHAGAWVRVEGLKSRTCLNGQTGILLEFDSGEDRWNVAMNDGGGLSLKAANITRVTEEEEDDDEVNGKLAAKQMSQEFRERLHTLVQQALDDGNKYTQGILSQRLNGLPSATSSSSLDSAASKGRSESTVKWNLAPVKEERNRSPEELTTKIVGKGWLNEVSPRKGGLAIKGVSAEDILQDEASESSLVTPPGGSATQDDGAAKLQRGDEQPNGTSNGRTAVRDGCGVEKDAMLHAIHNTAEGRPEPMKTPVFADAAAMKDKVREAIHKVPYRVSDFYWQIGVAQRIARSNWFDQLTIFVIAINAGWIAVDTELNDAAVLTQADQVFIVVENFFCLYFFLEWSVRFCAFRRKRDGFTDQCFCFDSTLVFFMVMETWVTPAIFTFAGDSSGQGLGDASILRLVRLLRLTRMARMARLLRAMPELMILVKAIFVAFRSVFFTICLLMIIVYVFAIAFVQLTEESSVGDEYFDGVFAAMGSLLLAGNLPDHEKFVRDVTTGNPLWGIILMFFIFLAPLTLMGMLAGVLVEVVSVVSAVEKEAMVVNYVTEQLHKMLKEIDLDHNDSIEREEFQRLVVRPDAARMMASVGVDVIGLAEFCDFLFADADEISFASFIELVLQLRGTNQATVKDVVDMRKFMRQELSDLVIGELSAMEQRLAVRFISGFSKQDLGPEEELETRRARMARRVTRARSALDAVSPTNRSNQRVVEYHTRGAAAESAHL
eukprot:TRINITY_DN18808_c0_g1_i1.p1 TRINITY_DN18808_c0_g1~~TRINITY_DN18808_c0_g1_i1.p1  ORF type:complete len:820 (-),score=187.76 TRINITY_DN18808_c0_g1_i1:40-2499(-)